MLDTDETSAVKLALICFHEYEIEASAEEKGRLRQLTFEKRRPQNLKDFEELATTVFNEGGRSFAKLLYKIHSSPFLDSETLKIANEFLIRNVIFNGDDGLNFEDHLEESMRLSTLKAKKDFPVWTLDLLAPFTYEEVSRLIIEVVLNSQDEMRFNMRSIFEVVSAIMALYPDSNLSQWKEPCRQSLTDVLDDSSNNESSKEQIMEAFLRPFCVIRKLHSGCPQTQYKKWFHQELCATENGYLSNNSSNLQLAKKRWSQFIRLLNELVPYESSPTYIRVHITAQPQLPSPELREEWQEYKNLLRTRLRDLEPETRNVPEIDIEEVSQQAISDVDRALEVMKNQGRVCPNLLQITIFQKPYFLKQIAPLLRLKEKESEEAKRVYQELRKMGKIKD